MKETKIWWHCFYGSATPVAHILRREIPDRWMRIHSLPESKRYPETASEYSLLLSRHNLAATEILGSGNQCILFAAQYVENTEAGICLRNNSQFENIDFRLFTTVKFPDSEVEHTFAPSPINVWFTPIIWSSGKFDKTISDIADDKSQSILFVSWETGEAYAPYDGGADLFLTSTARRDKLKQIYKHWLSSHPAGL